MGILCGRALTVQIFPSWISLPEYVSETYSECRSVNRYNLFYSHVIASTIISWANTRKREWTNKKETIFRKESSTKRKLCLKNIFNFLRSAHKYQWKLIIRSASSMKARRFEFHLPSLYLPSYSSDKAPAFMVAWYRIDMCMKQPKKYFLLTKRKKL